MYIADKSLIRGSESKKKKMTNFSLYVALPIITIFWLIVGGIVPWFIPGKVPNRG